MTEIEPKALFQRIVPGPTSEVPEIAEITDRDGNHVAELVKDSVAYEMFYRGIGVTPDASLTDIVTGGAILISLGYSSQFDT